MTKQAMTAAAASFEARALAALLPPGHGGSPPSEDELEAMLNLLGSQEDYDESGMDSCDALADAADAGAGLGPGALFGWDSSQLGMIAVLVGVILMLLYVVDSERSAGRRIRRPGQRWIGLKDL